MKDMIPVFREGSPLPVDRVYVAGLRRPVTPHWQPAPMATYEAVPAEGDLPSCLRKLQVGQKMLFSCDYIKAANAARNASRYGMHLRIHKSARDGGIWIGRRA